MRSTVRFEELHSSLWPDVERLFGPNGACAGCWCMWWRVESRKRWNEIKGVRAKETLKKLVQSGKAQGVLAFVEDEPVGWCAFGPRRDFPMLETVHAYERNDVDDSWSIVCFFIHRRWRRKGLSRGLLNAAVEAMKKHGVKAVEAYPVTTTKDGRRVNSFLAYTGPLKIFEGLGFKTIQTTNPLRPLVILQLSTG